MTAAAPVILTVNAGSSSLKFALFDARGCRVAGGVAEAQGPAAPAHLVWVEGPQVQSMELPGAAFDLEQALQALVGQLQHRGLLATVRVAVHRVVHGGSRFLAPVCVDGDVLIELRRLAPLAPLHQPANLRGIEILGQTAPGLVQFAAFDTAFFAGLTDVETRLPLPRDLCAQGLRRYGFHGLAYQHLMDTVGAHSTRSQGRTVLAHLGSGASLAAVQGGRPVATSMGFSALDGLMMSTRSGSLDPGVVLHLLEQGWTCAALRDLLYRRSGLLGVSGVSGDWRRLRDGQSPAEREALELFRHRAVREMGALVACLQGLDLLVFSGGIGQHDADLRATLATALAWLGVRLDVARNHAATGDGVARIDATDSAVEVWVIPADEERVLARIGQSAIPTEGAGADGRPMTAACS